MTKSNSVLASIDEVFILRLAFLFSGQFALYEGFQDWNRGQPLDRHPEVAILTLTIYALSLLTIAAALSSSRTVLKLRNLPLLPLLLATLTSLYVVSTIAYRGDYRTDVLAYSHFSAILFAKEGLNPYVQDMTGALQMFAVHPSDLTPLTSGAYLTTYQYPALHFLVFVPFVWVGLQDMRWVLGLFEVAIALTVYFKGPQKLRPMLILPLFAGSDLMINFTAASVSDVLWVLPLLFAAFYIESPSRSGLFYGLACSMKQTPWLLLPFLLVYMIRAEGVEVLRDRLLRAAKFAIAAAAVFFAVNLPFMIMSTEAWFRNLLTPMSEDLVILSQGASVLSEIGLLPVGKAFYGVLTIAVSVVLIANYYVYFDRLQHMLWILPGIILWFSYRALTSYIIYWTPLLLVAMILWYKAEQAKTVHRT